MLLALFLFLATVVSASDLEHQYRTEIRRLETVTPSLELSEACSGLAALYFERSDFSRAELLSRRALNVERSLAVQRPREIARRLNNVAAALVALRRSAQALPLIRESLAIYEREHSPADAAFALNTLGTLELWRHNYSRAQQHFTDALKRMVESRDRAGVLANLAMADEGSGQLSAALDHWREALSLSEALEDRVHAALLSRYGSALMRAGRAREGRAMRERGQALLALTPAPSARTVDRSDFAPVSR